MLVIFSFNKLPSLMVKERECQLTVVPSHLWEVCLVPQHRLLGLLHVLQMTPKCLQHHL